MTTHLAQMHAAIMQFLCLQYTWALDDNFKGIFVYFVVSTNIRSAVAVADAADLLIFFFFDFSITLEYRN